MDPVFPKHHLLFLQELGMVWKVRKVTAILLRSFCQESWLSLKSP